MGWLKQPLGFEPGSFWQEEDGSGDRRDAAGEEEDVAEDRRAGISRRLFLLQLSLVSGERFLRQHEVRDEVLKLFASCHLCIFFLGWQATLLD